MSQCDGEVMYIFFFYLFFRLYRGVGVEALRARDFYDYGATVYSVAFWMWDRSDLWDNSE